MNTLDPCSLSNAARESLRVGRKPKQVIFVYTLVLTALALATTLLDYLLGLQVDQTTGLDNMEFNSLLSSLRSLLPVAQMVVSACLQLGYLWTMLRVSRKLYADAHDLKKGFSRVGPLVRCFLLKMALYMGLSFLLTMPASMLFSISPWANSLNELMPVMEDPNMAAAMLTDPAAGNQLLLALLPMVIMFALVYLIVLIPVHFRLRMATYLLADAGQLHETGQGGSAPVVVAWVECGIEPFDVYGSDPLSAGDTAAHLCREHGVDQLWAVPGCSVCGPVFSAQPDRTRLHSCL